MRYAADWTKEAEASLDELAKEFPLLASFVLDHIDILCTNPTGLGRRPNFVHRIHSKRYEFETEDGGFRFFVFFQLGEDERTLHLLDIGWVKYAGADEDRWR
jgi:hypothetical protein